ncbi:acetyltransferase [Citrobacter koseri]|uniref:Acetyltransferase n=1 Tax=Citrobacter koseri TaxID=545 RepID=A0A2X2WAS1_CITKO|nr:acetyltransferase [Citrobacter koseri]
MIRESRTDDMASILTLWMESTIYAHPFIEARYWRESEPIVRDVYLPAAQTWVWEEAGLLKGFASVMEARFLGALFVTPDAIPQRDWQGAGAACSAALYRAQPGGLPEKSVGGEFLPCAGFSYRRQRMAGRYTASDMDYGLAGGLNAVSVSEGPVYFFNPRQRGVARTAVPQSRTGEIFGQHVYRAIFTNAASRHL